MRCTTTGAVRGAGIVALVGLSLVTAVAATPRDAHGQRTTPRMAERAPACGVERWPVKVLIDDDTARVDLTPRPTTIAALARLPAPRANRQQKRRLPLELRTFRVRAIITGGDDTENDGDIHLIIADPADRSVTMIAEIPDPECAIGSRHTAAYAEARRVVSRLPPGTEVEIEGVAFWDRLHGQTGVAPNAIEIHPVLRVTPIDLLQGGDPGGPRRPPIPADTSRIRVWLNLNSRVYHCPGSATYGRTARGEYLREGEARRRGGRPAGGRTCV
jgi:hypothetical protein